MTNRNRTSKGFRLARKLKVALQVEAAFFAAWAATTDR